MSETKHIRQTVDDGDCSVAAIAMATDKTYDEVTYYVPQSVYKHGLWIASAQYALMFLTESPWGLKYWAAPFFKQLSRYDFPKEKCVYVVTRPECKDAIHYFMCDGEYLYDPLLPDRITLEQAKLQYHGGWNMLAELRR